MSEDKTKYVSVMPDFSRPEVWMPLVKAMMEGHQKQTAKTVRFQSKQMLTSVFFSNALRIAKDQQDFWKTIEEVSTTELRYLKAQGDTEIEKPHGTAWGVYNAIAGDKQ